MGLVYADIELINADDIALTRRNIISKEEVKRIYINMLVNSGAYMMAINKTIQAQLDLPFIEKRKAQMASGEEVEYEVVGPLMLNLPTALPLAAPLYYQAIANHF